MTEEEWVTVGTIMRRRAWRNMVKRFYAPVKVEFS